MMSETLAQYSAYMVVQHKYGKDYMHRVLRHFLDRYLRGPSGRNTSRAAASISAA